MALFGGAVSTGLDYVILKETLDENIDNVNKAFSGIIDLLKKPDLLNTVIQSESAVSVISAIKGISLTLCVLFFLIDFFQKTLNLQWVKWENVMMLLIKLVFAKVLIDKSPEICEAIYNGLTSIVNTVATSLKSSSFKFISNGDYEAFWLTENEANKLRNPPAVGFLDFSPILISLKSSIMSFIMILILGLSEIIVLGRLFELTVYTIVAPLPLSTFATDSLQEVGKNFLKSYAAVSVQALVIVIMIVSYTLIINQIPPFLFGFDALLKILTLSIGIFQSGNWAKKICSAM